MAHTHGPMRRNWSASPKKRRLKSPPPRSNPDATLAAIAKAAGVSRSTVVNARDELTAEARKEARGKPPPKAAESAERRERAQRFLREQLGHGPRPGL